MTRGRTGSLRLDLYRTFICYSHPAFTGAFPVPFSLLQDGSRIHKARQAPHPLDAPATGAEVSATGHSVIGKPPPQTPASRLGVIITSIAPRLNLSQMTFGGPVHRSFLTLAFCSPTLAAQCRDVTICPAVQRKTTISFVRWYP